MPSKLLIVDGIRPVPQGGLKAFSVNGRAVVTHSNKGALNDYRAAIHGGWQNVMASPLDGGVELLVTFQFARPKAHMGKHGRRASAPIEMVTRPDIDKLVRSVLDALTGVLYLDDSQVYRLTVDKMYSNDGIERTIITARWDDGN